jgi:TM2 domain-containing membrane protein YozV
MEYTVTGADRNTGKAVTLTIDAESPSAAEERANRYGVLCSSVTPAPLPTRTAADAASGLTSYCRACGSKIDSRAEICVKCGVRQETARASGMAGESRRIPAALLAIVLGAFGIHKFYLGQRVQGILYIIVGLVTFFIVTWIFGIIEGIIYLCMSDHEFESTYPRR